MNFRLVKLSHHLLGTFVPSAYTLFSNLVANSCRICIMYCLSTSAWFLSAGASNAWLSGKPASPGIAKLVSRATFITACTTCQHMHNTSPQNHPSPTPLQFFLHRTKRIPPAQSTSSTKRRTYLLSLPPPQPRFNLPQHLTHKQNPIYQHPIRRPLDLKVAEKGIGAEERQDFIKRIIRFVRGVDGQVCDVGGEGWELDGWAAGAGAEGEEGKVACGMVIRDWGVQRIQRVVVGWVPISCWFGSSRKISR